MKNQLFLMSAMLLTFVCSTFTFAQSENLLIRANQQYRKSVIEMMKSEAKKFKLEIEPNKINIRSGKFETVVNVRVAGKEEMNEKNLMRGINTGFVYINSSLKSNIKNGFYISRVRSLDRGKITLTELVDMKGNVTNLEPLYDPNCPPKNEPQGYVKITMDQWLVNYRGWHDNLIPMTSCYTIPGNPPDVPDVEHCGYIFEPV